MAIHEPLELSELRLFLQEICGELCRFRHVETDGLEPELIRVEREVWLGADPKAFADIKVTPGDNPPYFVEIKWGYDNDEFIERLKRKYEEPLTSLAHKIIVVTDLA